LFVGCYEAELGERFDRPTSWPSRISFELTGEPADLFSWFLAKSGLPAPYPPEWRLAEEVVATVDWGDFDSSYFQLVLRAEPFGFTAHLPSEDNPMTAKSVRKVPCK
jgi:hypothetical protein